nr:uncharacterized protein LOC131770966 isoform X2 [Pocillopora verrucosa]
MASSSKRAEMALEKIFDDEDSADVMDSGGESDLDRQVENESGDQVGDDERPKEASASTKEPMAPVAGPSAPSAAASPIPPVSSAAPFGKSWVSIMKFIYFPERLILYTLK